MTVDPPRSLTFRLDALVLVCKACGKRDSGPRGAKPKQVAQQLKRSAKDARLKTRVVMTSCLGLCPKRATAVVAVAGAAEAGVPAQFAIESLDQVPAVLAGISSAQA